LEINNIFTFCC